MPSKEKKISKKQVEDAKKLHLEINETLVSNMSEYINLLNNKWRVFWLNLFSGMGRGAGFAIGFALVTALIVSLLIPMIKGVFSHVDIPYISQFILELVDNVQKNIDVSNFETHN